MVFEAGAVTAFAFGQRPVARRNLRQFSTGFQFDEIVFDLISRVDEAREVVARALAGTEFVPFNLRSPGKRPGDGVSSVWRRSFWNDEIRPFRFWRCRSGDRLPGCKDATGKCNAAGAAHERNQHCANQGEFHRPHFEDGNRGTPARILTSVSRSVRPRLHSVWAETHPASAQSASIPRVCFPSRSIANTIAG